MSAIRDPLADHLLTPQNAALRVMTEIEKALLRRLLQQAVSNLLS